MKHQHAKLICIEGMDGSGKTTLVEALEEKYKSIYNVLVVQDPGFTKLGLDLRAVLKSEVLPFETAALLFTAVRSTTVSKLNQIVDLKSPANLIIFDRWFMSTLVYQARMRVDRVDRVAYLDKEFVAFEYQRYMDYYYLDVDPVVAAARRGGGKSDVYDAASVDEYHRRRDMYLGAVDFIRSSPDGLGTVTTIHNPEKKSVDEIINHEIEV